MGPAQAEQADPEAAAWLERWAAPEPEDDDGSMPPLEQDTEVEPMPVAPPPAPPPGLGPDIGPDAPVRVMRRRLRELRGQVLPARAQGPGVLRGRLRRQP